MKRWTLAGSLLIGLSLVGCSGGDPAPTASTPAPVATSEAPVSTAPSSPASTSAAPSSSASTEAGRPCLDGTFSVGSFNVVGANGKTATGDGGGLAISFANGNYRMTQKGKKAATINLNGETGEFEIDGRIDGSYDQTGGKVTFKVTKSTGSVILRDTSGQEQKRPASQFAGVMGPAGAADITCTDKGLKLKTDKQEFELTR